MELAEKVDVIINVYGKPWQTLCTLKSLMLHSGEHIDKIYFIEEREQPYGDNVKWVLNEFDNIIHYIYVFYIHFQYLYSSIFVRLRNRNSTKTNIKSKKYVYLLINIFI